MTTAPTTTPASSSAGATTHPAHTLGASLVLFIRQTWAGLRVLLGFTILLGIAYPLAVTGVGQLVLPWQANGSLVTATGAHATAPGDADVVGSALIGQKSDGAEWFHPIEALVASNHSPRYDLLRAHVVVNSVLWGLLAATEDVVMGRSDEPLEVALQRALEAIRPHAGSADPTQDASSDGPA